MQKPKSINELGRCCLWFFDFFFLLFISTFTFACAYGVIVFYVYLFCLCRDCTINTGTIYITTKSCNKKPEGMKSINSGIC